MNLDLCFRSGDRNEFIITSITSALKSLLNLRALKLGFINQIITVDDGIQQLFKILKNLKLLTFLCLSFGKENIITDHELESLSQSLNELTLLKNLDLSFTNTNSLTNKGIETLAHAIQRLHNLQNLRLSFEYFHQVDERGVKMVGEALQNLPFLSLFSFRSCGSLPGKKKASSFASLLAVLTKIQNPMEIILKIPYDEVKCQEAEKLLKVKYLVVRFFEP